MGFAMGINYVLLTGFTVPTEITAIGLMIGFWDENSSHVSTAPLAARAIRLKTIRATRLVVMSASRGDISHTRFTDFNSRQQLAAYIAVFLVLCLAFNCLSVRWYGEVEFFFACLKVVLLVVCLHLHP